VGLVEEICTEINNTASPDPEISNRLASLGHDRGHINHFANELRELRPYSIDTFLETRREFREVGKAAIADVLLRAEARSSVNHAPPETDWYRYLLNKILLPKSVDDFRSQARRLTIVTFNFDRSFEWVLFSRVRAQFGLTDSAARELATELRLHHAHGLLGEPRWLASDDKDPDATAFGALSTDALQSATAIAVRSMKMVDDTGSQTILEDVEAAIQKAAHLYFIGFGFEDRNTAKLGLPDSAKEAIVRGTVLGMTALEQRPIHGLFGSQKVHLYPTDAMTFVSNYAETLFE
jgi:hypothetical protein